MTDSLRNEDGSIRAWDNGNLYDVYPGGHKVEHKHRWRDTDLANLVQCRCGITQRRPQDPEWVSVGMFPREKYRITESDEGWEVFVKDDHGTFS